MFDLRTLRSFVAVAEELHFSRAAQRLNISQPPLTKQIQNLEARLGAKLFERTKRSVRLTAAGSILLRDARSILSQSESTVLAIRRAQAGEAGTLRIGLISAALFSEVWSRFAEVLLALEDVSLVVHELGSAAQIEAIRHNRIDLAFVHTPIEHRGLSSRMMAREPFMVAMSTKHRFANHRSIDLAKIADEDFVLASRETAPGYYDQIIAICSKAGFSPAIPHSPRNLLTMFKLVSMGLGVSVVPRSAGAAPIPGVVMRPIRDIAMRAELSVVWQADNPLPVLHRVLGQLIEKRPRMSG